MKIHVKIRISNLLEDIQLVGFLFSFVQILVNFRQISRKCCRCFYLLSIPFGSWLNPGFAERSTRSAIMGGTGLRDKL